MPHRLPTAASPATAGPRRSLVGAPSIGRAIVLAATFALLAGSSGCTVFQHARRTIWYEPWQFSAKHDRQRSLKAYRSWAEEAWQRECSACPEPPSKYYIRGFKDGFVDFVYAGGDGQPPPVPPRKFWNLTWRSPEGHTAADHWFAGYRHGAKSARAGGYRSLGVVYSSLRSAGPAAWAPGLELAPAGTPSEALLVPGEILPAPPPEDGAADARKADDAIGAAEADDAEDASDESAEADDAMPSVEGAAAEMSEPIEGGAPPADALDDDGASEPPAIPAPPVRAPAAEDEPAPDADRATPESSEDLFPDPASSDQTSTAAQRFRQALTHAGSPREVAAPSSGGKHAFARSVAVHSAQLSAAKAEPSNAFEKSALQVVPAAAWSEPAPSNPSVSAR